MPGDGSPTLRRSIVERVYVGFATRRFVASGSMSAARLAARQGTRAWIPAKRKSGWENKPELPWVDRRFAIPNCPFDLSAFIFTDIVALKL